MKPTREANALTRPDAEVVQVVARGVNTHCSLCCNPPFNSICSHDTSSTCSRYLTTGLTRSVIRLHAAAAVTQLSFPSPCFSVSTLEGSLSVSRLVPQQCFRRSCLAKAPLFTILPERAMSCDATSLPLPVAPPVAAASSATTGLPFEFTPWNHDGSAKTGSGQTFSQRRLRPHSPVPKETPLVF